MLNTEPFSQQNILAQAYFPRFDTIVLDQESFSSRLRRACTLGLAIGMGFLGGCKKADSELPWFKADEIVAVQKGMVGQEVIVNGPLTFTCDSSYTVHHPAMTTFMYVGKVLIPVYHPSYDTIQPQFWYSMSGLSILTEEQFPDGATHVRGELKEAQDHSVYLEASKAWFCEQPQVK